MIVTVAEARPRLAMTAEAVAVDPTAAEAASGGKARPLVNVSCGSIWTLLEATPAASGAPTAGSAGAPWDVPPYRTPVSYSTCNLPVESTARVGSEATSGSSLSWTGVAATPAATVVPKIWSAWPSDCCQ